MTFYLVRLKKNPLLFVGKKNTSYAFTSDQEIAQGLSLQEDAQWFCPKKFAKVWTTIGPIKTRMSYNRTGTHTFSEYQLVIIENGVETTKPLDSIR